MKSRPLVAVAIASAALAACQLLANIHEHPAEADDAGDAAILDGALEDGDASASDDVVLFDGALPECGAPPLAAASASAMALAPAFAGLYKTYVLGAPPGTSPGQLNSAVISPVYPSSLVLAVNDVDAGSSAVWIAPVARDACGHITGFAGPATLRSPRPETLVATAYGPGDVFFVLTGTAGYTLAQVPPGSDLFPYVIDLGTLGFEADAATTSGIASLAFAPQRSSDDAGQARVLTTRGSWYQLAYTPQQTWFAVQSVTQTRMFPPGTTSAAYVPGGSPGFGSPSLLVVIDDHMDAYDVDSDGEPILDAGRPFFSVAVGLAAAGMTFEPKTGDLLVAANNLPGTPGFGLYLVRDFARPPPLR